MTERRYRPPAQAESSVSDEFKNHDDHLDAESCHAKAVECRKLASADKNAAHKIMLLHMAETWERIAKTYENGR